ncbi:hypothetical protein ACLOJK_004738, partial [Asimina triloba]
MLKMRLGFPFQTSDSMVATALSVGFEGDGGHAAESGIKMLPPSFCPDRINRSDITGGGSHRQPVGEDEAPYEVLRRCTEPD